MKKFRNISLRFLTFVITFSLILVLGACDDSFTSKIETEKEIATTAKNENNGNDPKVFSPGNNGIIVVKYLGTHSVRFKWHKSRDKDSNPLEVSYLIYYSLENNIRTVEDAEANGELAYEGFNFNQYMLTGLEDDIDYYINIVAIDDNGNKIIYNTIAVETLEDH